MFVWPCLLSFFYIWIGFVFHVIYIICWIIQLSWFYVPFDIFWWQNLLYCFFPLVCSAFRQRPVVSYSLKIQLSCRREPILCNFLCAFRLFLEVVFSWYVLSLSKDLWYGVVGWVLIWGCKVVIVIIRPPVKYVKKRQTWKRQITVVPPPPGWALGSWAREQLRIKNMDQI